MVMHADDQIQNDKPKSFNRTGIPNNLKQKMEDSSGFSLDHVRVDYNSDEPKKIKALAYTQGEEIYLAPKQEKHLEHELTHVVQQKEGRVKPTDTINGKVINDSPALEDEASAPMQGSSLSEDSLKDIPLSGDQPIQMMKEEEKGEKDSVFDIGKLKIHIGELIKEINDKDKGWPSKALDKGVLTQYAIRVQNLLEDIRQVDLQFLAATALSYDDDTREARKTPKNALTQKEDDRLKTPKEKEEQQKYKGILLEKLEYMRSIQYDLKDRLTRAEQAYDIAFGNFARSKKEKTVRRFETVKNEKKEKYDSEKQSSGRYLKDVEDQIKLLEGTIENSDNKGYMFNQNALMNKIDGKIKLYMAIVAPSTSRKDITKKEGKIKTSGMHQWSIATPVRAFSWLTKYLMDKSAISNTSPLIRTMSASPEAIKELQQGAISEQFKEDLPKSKEPKPPMNEDFKVPDQYGIDPDSDEFKKFIRSNPELKTVAQNEVMPEDLKEGAGEIQEYDDFKKDIGFSRSKNGKIKATDVHFFDHQHTAFHEIIDEKAPSLYSPEKAKTLSEKYNEKMDQFIHLLGKKNYVKKAEAKKIIGKNILSDMKVREALKELLEANHCLPPGAKNDLYGNSVSAKKSEHDFALKHIGKSDKNLESLINLTELRYNSLFHSKLEKDYSKNALKKANQKKENKKNELLDSIGIKLEVELLAKPLENANNDFVAEKLFDTTDSVEKYFDALKILAKKAISEEDTEIKVRVTAFCFKLLRTIMDNIPGNSENITPNAEHVQKEKELLSTRESGDYYDVLNQQQHKIIPANEDDPKSKAILIPYDKLTSKGRFKPEDNKTQKEQVPFVGGASGTTRDMTRDLMEQGIKDSENDWLKDEKDYWNFQLMNAAFMITYDYHSFVEVLFRAATTRLEYVKEVPGSDPSKAKRIYNFLKAIAEDKIKDMKNEDIINVITKIVEKDTKK